MNEKYLRTHRDELKASSAAVTPICIVVDVSLSMTLYKDRLGKSRMDRLKEGIDEFFAEIRNDARLSDSVEVAVVTFNDKAELIQPFATIDNLGEIQFPKPRGTGDTPKGVELALRVLKQEKGFLDGQGKSYNQPWIVIMSDGRATPAKDPVTGVKDYDGISLRLQYVQKRVKDMEAANKLTVIPVFISEPSDGEYKQGKKQITHGISLKQFVNLFKLLEEV